MAPPADNGRGGNLRKRVLSAAVLAPVVLGAVLLGRPWFHLLLVAAAGILAWEWVRLCQNGRVELPGWLLVAAAASSVVVASVFSPAIAITSNTPKTVTLQFSTVANPVTVALF